MKLYLSKVTAKRLARLHLACGETGVTQHIAVQVTKEAVHFTTVNGQMLARVTVPIPNKDGAPSEMLTQTAEFTDAFAVGMKVKGPTLWVDVSATRMLVGNRHDGYTVVHQVQGTPPRLDGMWARADGCQWYPSLGCIDPRLAALAQKIQGGSSPLMFFSPGAEGLKNVWASPGTVPADKKVLAKDMRDLLTAPSYWWDKELMIVVMPFARYDTHPEFAFPTYTSTPVKDEFAHA